MPDVTVISTPIAAAKGSDALDAPAPLQALGDADTADMFKDESAAPAPEGEQAGAAPKPAPAPATGTKPEDGSAPNPPEAGEAAKPEGEGEVKKEGGDPPATGKIAEQREQLRKGFAQLSKDQAKFGRERESLNRQKQEIEQAKEKISAYENASRLARDNPIELVSALKMQVPKERLLDFIAAAGFEFQDVLNAALNQPPDHPLNKEIAGLKGQVKTLNDELEKSRKEKQEAADAVKGEELKQTQERWRAKAKKEIDSSDDYALLQAQGDDGVDMVYSTTLAYYETHKKVPPLAEVIKIVEADLQERYKAALSKEPARKRLLGDHAQPSASQSKQDPPQQPAPRTESSAAPQARTQTPHAASGATLSNDIHSDGPQRSSAGSGLKSLTDPDVMREVFK